MRRAFAALAACAAALSAAPHAGAVNPPTVPMEIEVPEGYRLFRAEHAIGTQNYFCVVKETESGPVYSWTAFGPQATLFDGKRQTATHFLSANPEEAGALRPAWQDSRDSSILWAMPDREYPVADSIPWLRLEVVNAEAGPTGGIRIARAGYVQRINTSGGVKPATGCSEAAHVGTRALVPYETDYLFYRATNRVE